MVKVFDVILDPHFKLEDITFKSLWDVFEHISAFRGQAPSPVQIEPIATPQAHPYSVSPLAVSLIVERMMEDRLPLDNLVKEKDWKVGFAK